MVVDTLLLNAGSCARTFAAADFWFAAANLMIATGVLGLGTCVIGSVLRALCRHSEPALNQRCGRRRLRRINDDRHRVLPLVEPLVRRDQAL